MKKSVDIALPVYYGNLNEIEPAIKQLEYFLIKELNDYNWNIIIAINGKNAESVINLAKKLSKKYKNVKYVYTPNKGKGEGVIKAWTTSSSDILAYMDIDLSTSLYSFRNLINTIEQGYDIAIGSRYHKDSKIKRSTKRYIISRVYHSFFIKLILNAKYSDAQCGFKAVNQRVVKEILPLLKDHFWYFETELLYLAQKKGFKIKSIPVIWRENPKSGVNLFTTSLSFIIKSIKLRFRKI